jgi:cell division protein ZapA (FtsZ GTPase activity inhibitor)
MEQKHLQIKIGDREYPVVVPAGDEIRVRQAEQLINTKLKEYREMYPVADKTDHVAMTAFFLANALVSVETPTQTDLDAVSKEIVLLKQLLEDVEITPGN